MNISPGLKLGSYQILSLLGKGGMGEVWRAQDTRLDRAVAIKVLPATLAHDADRLSRFALEAKATGALNHPNILTVHDIGTHENAPYIVAELLDGEELRAQLQNGGLPMRKAIDYAQQIAAGLTAAHEKNIVHRDLKPENLFVTKDGRVKILDFGLAKLTQTRKAERGARNEEASESRKAERGARNEEAETLLQDAPNPHRSEFRDHPLTIPGTVMGTIAYMSPEQVRGQDLDQRSDIFSFGLILFEMLAGRRAFQKPSAAETMAAIANEEPPDLSELNPKVTLQLEKIVRHCLEKKPELRFQSARDLGFALSTLTASSGSRLEATTALPELTDNLPATKKAGLFGNARLAWIAAAVMALVVLASLPFAVKHFRQPAPEMQVTRFTIPQPKGAETKVPAYLRLALSPDGRRLAFSSQDAGGKPHLWLRSFDSIATQLLPGTEGAIGSHFWSPDGRYIAFFADNKLKKLDTESGVIETICSAGAGQGGWNRNGVILFNNGDGTVLSRVNAAGGKPEAVTEMDAAQSETHGFPSFLPDGNHFLFRVSGGEQEGLYVGSLDSKARKLLMPLNSAIGKNLIWAAPGYILYAPDRRTLLARAFDPDRLELTGEPFRVAENLLGTAAGVARFTVSSNGVLAFAQASEQDTVQIAWQDRSGKRGGVVGPAAPWTQIRLSPDERLAALTRNESASSSIWLLDLGQGVITRFDSEANNAFPVWSPDGKQLAFTSSREGQPNVLFLKPYSSNVQAERLLPPTSISCFPGAWSPDGKFLIYTMSSARTQTDLWLLPMLGDRKTQPLLQTKFNEQAGRISLDGNWLAYQSDESGSNEIYVTQFPQPARSWRISRSGGVNPCWRGDGKELYFVAGNKLMAVSVTLGVEFQPGPPQPLFEIEGTNYAPSKDGQRFLVPVVTEKAPAPPINVVLNWAADLKR